MKIQGSFALVTGASSGIGQATAIALSTAGARTIAVLARDQKRLGNTKEACAVGTTVLPYVADLQLPDETVKTLARIHAELGTPDIIVNAAGAGRFVTLDESDLDEAVVAIAVPYVAALATVHEFLPNMLKRGSGRIVNITSPAAIAPWAGATAYAASRWAVRGFTYALQQDLYGTGVGATLVIPGKTDTPYFATNGQAWRRIPKVSHLVRTLQASEVAAAIVRAVEREQSEVILPGMLRAFALIHRFFPGTVQYLVRKTGWQRP